MIEADTIDRLVRLKPDDLPVLSMYVNLKAGDRRNAGSQVTSMLDGVRPLTMDESLDRDARLSVREDIEQIERAAREERWDPGAMAIFASSRRGVFEEVALPRSVPENLVVDATPWVRPMLAVLDEYHRACVVVISKGTARVFELYQNEMREASAFRDPTLRKPNYSVHGSEYRIRRRADELSNRHYRRTAEVLDQMWRTGGFEVLVIGGQDYEVPSFVEFLPYELSTRVAGMFTIDAAVAKLGEIQAAAQGVLDLYERDEEIRMVAETLDRHAMGGLATAGLSDSLWAGSVSAISLLLVQDGVAVPGVVCDQSGWLAEAGDTCPLCGNPTRPVPDVTDELVTQVINDSGSIKHIAAETELENVVTAAQLRFPLPPRP